MNKVRKREKAPDRAAADVNPAAAAADNVNGHLADDDAADVIRPPALYRGQAVENSRCVRGDRH